MTWCENCGEMELGGERGERRERGWALFIGGVAANF